MEYLSKPATAAAMLFDSLATYPSPSVDAKRASDLLSRCPVAQVTPMISVPDLARHAGVGAVFVNYERERMAVSDTHLTLQTKRRGCIY